MKHNEINCLPSQLIVDYKDINNPVTICECLNSYFIDIGRNLSKDINCSINPLVYVDSYHNTSLIIQLNRPMRSIKIYQQLNNNNNNNGHLLVLFLRRAHSPFIKNI